MAYRATRGGSAPQSTPNAQGANTANPLAPLPEIKNYGAMPIMGASNSPSFTPHEARMGRGTPQYANPLTPAKFDDPGESFQPNKDIGGGLYQKADGSYAAGPSGGGDPNTDVPYDYDKLIGQYDDIAAGYDPQGQPGVTDSQVSIGAPPEQEFQSGQESWRGSVGKGAGGGAYGGSVYQGPVYDYPEYNVGEFEFGASLDLPDYKAPEYDEGKEKAIREEFIQTSKGSLNKATQQAILGSANVNNPQARGQIIKAALEGFGDALGGVALKGSQEGRRGAEAEWGRDVQVYNTQFDIRAKEEVARYDQEMSEDLMNWELEVSGADREYGQQMSNWNSMPVDVQARQMQGRR